nr:mechanosensitive ion channel [Pseudomonadota bacterium]
MKRIFLLLVVLSWAAVASGLAAPARAAGTAAPAATDVAPLSVTDARQALAVLRNPRQRAMVEHTLDAIIRAGAAKPVAAAAAAKPAPAKAAPAAAAKPQVRLNPNGLGVLVLIGVSRFFDQLYARMAAAAHSAQSLPLLWGWVVVMATNPLERTLVQDVAWRVLVVFLLALGAEIGTRWALRRPRARLDLRMAATGGPDPSDEPVAPSAAVRTLQAEAAARGPDDAASSPAADPVLGAEAEALAEAGQTEPLPPPAPGRKPHFRLRRLGLAVPRFVLDVLPVLAFAMVGRLLVATPLGGLAQARLVIVALVDSYALWRGILCLVRVLFAPEHRSLRLLRVTNATAGWTTRWLARIAAVAVFGYAIGQAGLLLGLSTPAFEALMKFVGLINHVFLAVMVLQKRRAVRNWIRAPEGNRRLFARLRNTVAPVWHWFALALLAGEWLVWAVELPNGYAAMVRTFVLVAVVATGARILLTELHGALERVMHPRPEIAERYPGLEARLARYHPVLSMAVQTVVLVAALTVLLELFGIGVASWMTGTALGQRLASSVGTIVVTLVLALVVWEGVNASLLRQVARLTRDQHAARAARLRTLLPLLRAALVSAIGAIAGLTVLSQIGINIAPLLAGAGIIGVAIGFGSQKLVQDLITGIFLL